MAQNKFDIYVYAHWKGMAEPKPVGLLSLIMHKVEKRFLFEAFKVECGLFFHDHFV